MHVMNVRYVVSAAHSCIRYSPGFNVIMSTTVVQPAVVGDPHADPLVETILHPKLAELCFMSRAPEQAATALTGPAGNNTGDDDNAVPRSNHSRCYFGVPTTGFDADCVAAIQTISCNASCSHIRSEWSMLTQRKATQPKSFCQVRLVVGSEEFPQAKMCSGIERATSRPPRSIDETPKVSLIGAARFPWHAHQCVALL